jgi:hypothetical protein
MATPLDDMFGGFDDELDPNAGSNNRPDLGRGLYALARYFPKDTTKQGRILVAELITVQPPPGGEKKPGEMVSLAWFISKTDQIARRYERARAAGFVRALLGIPDKDPQTGKATDAGPHSLKLCASQQPGTGILIMINTEPNGQYRNYRFENVPGQTGEKIKAMRDRITSLNYNPNAQTQQAAAPPPAPTPPKPAAVDPLAALLGGNVGNNDIPF